MAAKLLMSFYGDDFTGATDAMESLARAGVRTVLFVAPPTPEQLGRYTGLGAVGVAGLTRSLPTEQMEAVLAPALAALGKLGAPIVHYKVCSTFDSSPAIGSIGKAIDVGAAVFGARCVPVLGGAPGLGRYCVFGNLFARSGPESAPFRLDRHPSMSRHPITPMDEADLRLLLARQTSKRFGLVDVLQLTADAGDADAHLEKLIADGAEVVLIDVLSDSQLQAAGRLLTACAARERAGGRTLFVVGPSGVEAALATWWRQAGVAEPATPFAKLGPAGPLLVLSGSCSPVTARQIAWALEHDFAEVPLDAVALAEGRTADAVEGAATVATIRLLGEGRSVVIHTGRSGEDPAGGPVAAALRARGYDAMGMRTRSAEIFGRALGRILRAAARASKVKRVVVAGGDTAGHIAREVGIESLEMIGELAPGAPLCRVYAPNSPADGLEITFKGGQIGTVDFLGLAAVGRGELLKTSKPPTRPGAAANRRQAGGRNKR
ncbi:MAG: four-carbon acid sugar kinase family protein [Phycisphaerae bacterium]|nr:four-carbon acid sugar kinase family protein [Phycisphaerae bacterium]